MEFNGIMKKITDMAKEEKKTIVLPEGNDERIIEAVKVISKNDIANIILLGDIESISKKLGLNSVDNVNNSNIKIINPKTSEYSQKFADALYNLRKNKGITLEQAKDLIQDNMYFATMMVKLDLADGMVAGATVATADTLRPALQIIKAKESVKTVSAFFLMETPKKNLGSNGVYVFADCGLIEFPNEEQLYDIVKESVESFKLVVQDRPKVAMLSYSTKGSAKSDAIDKMINVTNKVKLEKNDFDIDGELQLDAAIVPEVAKLKSPNSNVAGKANVLIFPDLQAGNIGYKLVQRFGDATALGPITQGLAKPVNDLSRGCNIQDIVGVVAITCVQARNTNI